MAELPIYDLRTRNEDGGRQIWDPLRKKFIQMSPEEFVRQNLIQFLIAEKNFPRGLMSVERGLTYNLMQKRYDLLVYDREGKALLLCECKSPKIEITEKTLRQSAIYNSKIGAPYIILTNGKSLFLFEKKASSGYSLRDELPDFSELLS